MEKEQKAVFATRLGLLRNSINMSQEQLASALEIDRGTIAKYETQSRIPSYEHLTLFAKYFKVSTDYLLGISDIQSNDTDMQAVCAYTGLSEEAVKILINRLSETYCFIDDYGIIQEVISSPYKDCAGIISEILSSNEFWNIIFSLKCLQKNTENYSEDLIFKTLTTPPDMIDEETKLKIETISNADIFRYDVSRKIEKISDMFDNRVKKEAEIIAKHNPKKE